MMFNRMSVDSIQRQGQCHESLIKSTDIPLSITHPVKAPFENLHSRGVDRQSHTGLILLC